MQTLRELALHYVGTPYKWGGNNAVEGFDCSGFVGELLKTAGVIPHSVDYNSQMIYNHLEQNGTMNRWGLGSVAFFGPSTREIVHVAFCLDTYRMVEAGGGDRATLTREDAAKKNACVRIRPIRYRRDLVSVIRPNYASIGLV